MHINEYHMYQFLVDEKFVDANLWTKLYGWKDELSWINLTHVIIVGRRDIPWLGTSMDIMAFSNETNVHLHTPWKGFCHGDISHADQVQQFRG